MMPGASVAGLDRFRATIAQRFGLYFDDSKSGTLAEALSKRVAASGGAADAYLALLEHTHCPRAEWRALAQLLTVSETFFFRNSEQFDALAQVALPERLAARGGARINILSVGCASGDEPYSLAILVRETAPSRVADVSIRAVDVNPAMIASAQSGTFSAWSLRGTSTERQSRWFKRAGNRFELDRSICDAVRFDERNLALDDPDLWCPASYDIVFCRNVLMYFGPEHARAAVARIATSIAPGGYLFLGHAETLRGLSNAFHLCHTHDTFYYRSKGAGAHDDVHAWPVLAEPWALPSLPSDTSWVETIRSAAERVHSLTHGGFETVGAVRAAPDLAGALALIERERFADAVVHLEAFPPEHAQDADVLLLRAVSLVHAGDLRAGEAACDALLARDELSAGAHYLLALCREGFGDLAGARQHDETAMYLDPAFAMARMHRGLLARREGAYGIARREFSAALDALQREDAARLLLFGGGFGREALAGMCRTALEMCAERDPA